MVRVLQYIACCIVHFKTHNNYLSCMQLMNMMTDLTTCVPTRLAVFMLKYSMDNYNGVIDSA